MSKLVSRKDIYEAAKKRMTPREFEVCKQGIDSILEVVNLEKGISKTEGWLAGWKAAVEYGTDLYFHAVEAKNFIKEGFKLMELAAEEERPEILGL